MEVSEAIKLLSLALVCGAFLALLVSYVDPWIVWHVPHARYAVVLLAGLSGYLIGRFD